MDLKTNKVLIFILKLSISVISLYIVFSKADIRQVFIALKNIGVFYFLTASFIFILAQMISTLRWKLLLPEKFKFKKLFSLYMMGSFFGTFLPGIIGGDAVRAYYLNKDAKKISLALASIFMDRYIGYAGLMIIGVTAFPFALGYFSQTNYKWLMPAIFVSFVIASILFFGLQIGRRFRVLSEFYDYFVSLRTRKDVIIKTLLLSFLVQFVNFSKVILLAYAMNAKIPLIVLFVFLPIVITVITIPISISGLGLREGSMLFLLGLIGIKPEIATSLSLVWFFAVFVGSLPGLAIYIKQGSKADQD